MVPAARISADGYHDLVGSICSCTDLSRDEDLVDIDVVYSSSGNTLRPKVNIEFVMDKRTVFTLANIIERVDLKYPMIIGRRALKKFLVEIR